VEGLKGVYSFVGNPSQSYRVSPLTSHMGSHSVTSHSTQVNVPHLSRARQTSTRIAGWTDLGGWSYTKMVYMSTDSQQAKLDPIAIAY